MAFWAEALATETYLINRRPCHATGTITPYQLLLGITPNYGKLRVSGCCCYPNISATAQHKLDCRSTPCIFIGYPADHRGYRCYDATTRRVITSRHVTFDEQVFPFCDAATTTAPPRPPSTLEELPPNIPHHHTQLAADTPPCLSDAIATHPKHARTAQAPPQPNTPNNTQPLPSPPPPTSSTHPTTNADARHTPPAAPMGHPMVIHAKANIHKPNPKYTLAATAELTPIPRGVCAAVKDPHWHTTMKCEF